MARTKVHRSIYDEQVAIIRQRFPSDIEFQRESILRLNRLVEPVDVTPPSESEVTALARQYATASPGMNPGRAKALARKYLYPERGLDWEPATEDIQYLTAEEQTEFLSSAAFTERVPDGQPPRVQGAVLDAISAGEAYANEVQSRKADIRAALEPKYKAMMEAAAALGDRDDLHRIGTELQIGSLDRLVEREYEKQYVPKAGMTPEQMTLGQLREFLRAGGELSVPDGYEAGRTQMGSLPEGEPIATAPDGAL